MPTEVAVAIGYPRPCALHRRTTVVWRANRGSTFALRPLPLCGYKDRGALRWTTFAWLANRGSTFALPPPPLCGDVDRGALWWTTFAWLANGGSTFALRPPPLCGYEDRGALRWTTFAWLANRSSRSRGKRERRLVDLTGASWNQFQQFIRGIHSLRLACGSLADD